MRADPFVELPHRPRAVRPVSFRSASKHGDLQLRRSAYISMIPRTCGGFSAPDASSARLALSGYPAARYFFLALDAEPATRADGKVETMPTLHWLTRDEDMKVAKAVPYRLLEEVPSLGAGDRAAGNMLIQGDNLEALKALLPFYAGRVKCIYIDPPYNTRSAFEHYDDNSGTYPVAGHDVAAAGAAARSAVRGWLDLGFNRRQRRPLPQGHHGRGLRRKNFRRHGYLAKN